MTRVLRAPRAPAALAFVLLALLAPAASAQRTLSLDDLEEPQKLPADGNLRVIVTEEQANDPRAIIFRNPIRSGFGLAVIDPAGRTVYEDNGSRGVQTLPGLPAGTYTFLVRFREGEFQVVGPAFGVNRNESANGSIVGRADAYVVAVRSGYNFTVSGDVEAEWFDIRMTEPEHPSIPFTRTGVPGGAYVLTIRGAEATPYSIDVEPTTYVPPTATPDHSAHEENGLPGPGIVLLLLVAVLVALARRR